MVNEVDDISKEFQLPISTSKTKIMTTTKEREQLLIRCRGELPAQVDKFMYLESLIKKTVDCSYEIRARLGAVRSVFEPPYRYCLERSRPQHGHQAKDTKDKSMTNDIMWLRVVGTESCGYQQITSL